MGPVVSASQHKKVLAHIEVDPADSWARGSQPGIHYRIALNSPIDWASIPYMHMSAPCSWLCGMTAA